MPLTLIKLGGSIITNKSKPYTTRPEVIERLAKEIAEIRRIKPSLRFILGNGAGSFGHSSAKKYGTIDGLSDEVGRLGYALVQNDAAKLNRIIVESLLNENLPAMGLQSSAIYLAKNKKVVSENYQTLEEALKNNLIPVLYGDAVLDTQIGSTILSTDTIIQKLAEYLTSQQNYQIDSVIHLTDVSGVLDSQGQVISEINSNNFEEIQTHLRLPNASTDVTGGMSFKVQEMLELAKKDVDSWIISGLQPNNLSQIILEKKAAGTRISKS